jgi:hypothetical protein
MVYQGMVLGSIISDRGIEKVDKSEICLVCSLPPSTNVRNIYFFFEHKTFIKDSSKIFWILQGLYTCCYKRRWHSN